VSLLREIQEAAIDSNVELAVVLRKAKVLAARLGHGAFKNWVDQELNGYNSKDDLPDYRVLHVQSKGHFLGLLGSGIRNTPIPPSLLPKEYRDIATVNYLMDGVSACEALVKRDTSGSLTAPWPNDLVVLVGTEIIERMTLAQAWRVIPTNLIVGVLDTVRNRILSFALEIESEAPEVEEAKPGTQPITPEKVTQIFNTYVLGGTNIVASASSEISQTVHQPVHVNDLKSLKSYLTNLGLTPTDLQEMEEALEGDGPPKKSDRLGQKVAKWIGSMTGKAVSGAWQVSTSAAADILSKAIRSYYGLSS